MAMVFYGYAQHFECVHSNCGVFGSLLALEDQVDRSSEEADKGIALGCGYKDLTKLELEDFAHHLER